MFFFFGGFGNHRRLNASARIDGAFDACPTRSAGLDDVIQDFVDQMFVKNPDIPVKHQVIFKGFELNANFVGDIIDFDCGKIGQARFWADTGKFRRG